MKFASYIMLFTVVFNPHLLVFELRIILTIT
jgi:hypothetical protein